MAHTLIERFTNVHGVSWLRIHAYGVEGFAFCSNAIHPDADEIREGQGQITCPDCIEVIKLCKGIDDKDLVPEYTNELFNKRFERDY